MSLLLLFLVLASVCGFLFAAGLLAALLIARHEIKRHNDTWRCG
jgi:hypothetical protein